MRAGFVDTPTGRSWSAMHARCVARSGRDSKNYRERGISVCERWSSFDNFLADMGERPPGTTLERRENDGDYTPSNCVWADGRTQHNNKRSNRWIEFGGERRTLAQWARHLGMRTNTLHMRIGVHAWPLEKAFTTPVRPRTVRGNE